jgi:hypothetical protein
MFQSTLSAFLSQAWFLLAHPLDERDHTEAMRCIDKAIQVDQALNDSLSLEQHLCSRVWLQVQHHRLTGQPPLIIAEIESDFDHARDLLLPMPTLEARIQLGTLSAPRPRAGRSLAPLPVHSADAAPSRQISGAV